MFDTFFTTLILSLQNINATTYSYIFIEHMLQLDMSALPACIFHRSALSFARNLCTDLSQPNFNRHAATKIAIRPTSP